jgi:type III pantothenate kinase
MGGMIMPGLNLMKQSLAASTAQLEHITGTLTLFPQSTADAMFTGAVQSICGAVVQMYQTLAEHEETAPLLLLTGGDAPILHPFLEDRVPVTLEIIDNLVLDGLILLHQELREKA